MTMRQINRLCAFHRCLFLMGILFVGMLLSGCMPSLFSTEDEPALSAVGQSETSEATPDADLFEGKLVQMSTYKLTIPKEIEFQAAPGDVTIWKLDGETIGGVDVLHFNPQLQEITALLPNYSEIIKSTTVEETTHEAVRFYLKREIPTDGSSFRVKQETHTYVLQQPLAYDIWFVEGSLPTNVYEQIVQSFTLMYSST